MARRCLSLLPPASPFPRLRCHIRAEGGHTRVIAHPPLPSPRIDRRHPVRTEMRGATAGHTTSPLHVAPTPSPSPCRTSLRLPLSRKRVRMRDARAPPHPRMQEGGQRAHPSLPWRGRCQSNPMPRMHVRATPTPPHVHHTAPPVHARGGVQPLRAGYAGPVFTRPATPVDAGGSARPAQPPPHKVARGAAHEQNGGRIGAGMQKGDSDGDGGGVMNKAKRSRGEAVRANSGHPAPVDRLRKIHVKSS
ncbi:hypothetical protein EDB83DRAFT_2323497 [Lactarius deliciosus]|nr:hypothetical protein EDB83DRAFT_2323497 [Lactarius deliciosus]